MIAALSFWALFLIVIFCGSYGVTAVKMMLANDAASHPGPVGASYYGEGYRGRTMANGRPFDPDALTCAAWDWPLGTVLCVSYKEPLRNRAHSIVVTVTDRGPAKSTHRVIDLSQGAFKRLAPLNLGVIPVVVERVEGGRP